MSDPLGPLRSPLRPESSGPAHRREGAMSRRRGRYRGERSDSQTDTGSLRNRRFNRDDSYKDLDYHPQDFAELNNASDWPVVGSSSTNQNEGGFMIDRKGEGGGRRSVKDRLGPRPECKRQGRRELGQSDGQARLGHGQARLGQEGSHCDSRQGSRRRGRRNRSRKRGDGKRKRSEGEGEGGGEVEDGEIPCWAEVEGAGHHESWADQVEREEQQEIQREQQQQQQLRSRSFSLGSSTSSLSSRASLPGGRGGKRERERKEIPKEKDESVLARRLKQIEYGINTPEYQEYRRLVPKTERTKFHPRTPDRTRVYSRRSFDTIVRIWRKSLHFWDPTKPKTNAAAAAAGAGKIKNDDDACDMIASPRKKCKQEETETKHIGKSEYAVKSESVVSGKQEVKQEPAGAVEERKIKLESQHDESTLDGVKPFCTLDLGQDDEDHNINDDDDYQDDDDVKPVAFDLKLVKNEPENCAMECDDNEIKEVKQEPARRSLHIEAKSPLKSRDVNVGGVKVKEEPDDDFDMYADL